VAETKKRIAFTTLGCRVNQFETDALTGDFLRAGYEVVDFDAEADIYLINTCTITGKGEQKSRNLVNRALRHPGSKIVATGCSVETEAEYYNSIPELDLVIPNEKKHGTLKLVESLFTAAEAEPDVAPDVFGYRTADQTRRTRSMLKIHDGCNAFCSYCIVPFTRGRAISRPAEQILENALRLIQAGFKELVMTGVNMSTYLHGDTDFTALISRVLRLEGDFRVRIASVEPEKLDSGLLELFTDTKLCRHLHLCLQSGSERILKKMNRSYTASEFLTLAQELKNRYPDFNLTTDVIVGFPGEREEDFLQTLQLVQDAAFSHVHTFQFSPRAGTRAAEYPDQIPATIKQERSRRLRDLAEKQKETYRRSLLGKTQKVLIEQITADGSARGYSELYVPLRISGTEEGTNRFLKATPAALDPDSLDLLVTINATNT